MNEILHANIFFFIASIGTVVFMILTSVILFHVLKITKSIRSIVEKVEVGSEVLADDFAELRSQLMSGGFISRIFGLFMGFNDFTENTRSKRKSSTRSRRAKVREIDEDDE